MKNLDNKVIIITGAAMGLGLATEKELALRGANLSLVDYNEKALEDAKTEISKESSKYALHNPTKRLGLPNEVAKVVAFLLSDDASYVNGQTIAYDGGESNSYGIV